MTFYPLADIDCAALDSNDGTMIKPVLHMPQWFYWGETAAFVDAVLKELANRGVSI